MIRGVNNQTNIWIGDGDVGIGTALDDEGKACGVSFIQLKEPMEIGAELGRMDNGEREEGLRMVNILFLNRGGIESMIKGLERFLQSVAKDQEIEKGEVEEC